MTKNIYRIALLLCTIMLLTACLKGEPLNTYDVQGVEFLNDETPAVSVVTVGNVLIINQADIQYTMTGKPDDYKLVENRRDSPSQLESTTKYTLFVPDYEEASLKGQYLEMYGETLPTHHTPNQNE